MSPHFVPIYHLQSWMLSVYLKTHHFCTNCCLMLQVYVFKTEKLAASNCILFDCPYLGFLSVAAVQVEVDNSGQEGIAYSPLQTLLNEHPFFGL